jgi:aspartate kinase
LGIIVQKFGGTSVATAEGRAHLTRKVAEAAKHSDVVVVVSAMGRAPAPYATDTLLGLVDCDRSSAARELDALAACGEIISSVVVTAALRGLGLDAVSLTGAQAGIVTDDCHGQARIVHIDTARLVNHIKAGQIPVVAGFQGINSRGDMTTLGRGGSDTTAAALGAALGADRVEIYTDVTGVMSADPNVVPEARWQDSMTYTELIEMANLGAKVVHLQAVEIAMHSRTPLVIRSTFSDEEGTIVTDMAGKPTAPFAALRPVTAVATTGGRAQLIVEGGNLNVFSAMATNGVSVDMINVFPDRVAFIIAMADLPVARKVIDGLGHKVDVVEGCAKVSIVGEGMRGTPGIMARLATALAEAGVAILQTSDSHYSISCLVKSEQMETAARALHAQFGLGGM